MTAEVRALGPIRDAFRAGAWDELERTATDATAWLYAGVLALASDPERASRWLRRAADEAGPDRRLARALARHVDADRDRELSSSLYETQPDAFAAFVDGGTNPALYRATATALGAGRARPQSVLDIGTGDGRALVAFLDELGARPARIDAVEPAPDLAARLTARLADRGLAGRLHPTTLQRFSADLAADARWQVGVATFSLHTLAPDERRPCLGAPRAPRRRARGRRLRRAGLRRRPAGRSASATAPRATSAGSWSTTTTPSSSTGS